MQQHNKNKEVCICINDIKHIYDLVPNCVNSSANALELLQSYTKPSMWYSDETAPMKYSTSVLVLLGAWYRDKFLSLFSRK